MNRIRTSQEVIYEMVQDAVATIEGMNARLASAVS